MKVPRGIYIIVVILILSGCAYSPKRLVIDVAAGPNPWTHLQLNNNPDNFQFAIVSDRTGGLRPGIFESAVARLNLIQPEFVMCIGDLIEGYSEDFDELNRQWDEFDAIVRRLQMPFFYVPGNHDISNETMLELWQKRLGKPYYHFTYCNVLFLCLNSEDISTGDANFSDEQLRYFQDVLAKHPSVRWTMVFLHKPMFSGNNTSWDRMEQLLGGRRYTVFAGHAHSYLKTVRAGHNYYTFATTGGASKLKGIQDGQFDHIVWATMTDDGPTIANLTLDGIVGDDPQKTKDRSVFSFDVTADMREFADLNHATSQYFKGACEAIHQIGKGAFMVSPGDIDPPEHVYETIKTVLGPDYPWYPVVGNHEAETPEDMQWLRNYAKENLHGLVKPGPEGSEETTYSFDYKNAHFVVLNEYSDGRSDTGTSGDLCDTLYQWLKDDLQSNSKSFIFVFGHEPFVSIADVDNGHHRHKGDNLDEHPENSHRFHKLLREHNITAYINGHTHTFSYAKINGIWQIDTGHARGIGDPSVPSTFLKVHIGTYDCWLNAYRLDQNKNNYLLTQTITLD